MAWPCASSEWVECEEAFGVLMGKGGGGGMCSVVADGWLGVGIEMYEAT